MQKTQKAWQTKIERKCDSKGKYFDIHLLYFIAHLHCCQTALSTADKSAWFGPGWWNQAKAFIELPTKNEKR